MIYAVKDAKAAESIEDYGYDLRKRPFCTGNSLLMKIAIKNSSTTRFSLTSSSSSFCQPFQMDLLIPFSRSQ